MKNLILIKKKRLIFREDAQKLIQLIHREAKEKDLKVISLDFSDVDFFSRSFIDEFLNGLNELKKRGIKIQFLNLQPLLQGFITRVKKMKGKIQRALL